MHHIVQLLFKIAIVFTGCSDVNLKKEKRVLPCVSSADLELHVSYTNGSLFFDLRVVKTQLLSMTTINHKFNTYPIDCGSNKRNI